MSVGVPALVVGRVLISCLWESVLLAGHHGEGLRGSLTWLKIDQVIMAALCERLAWAIP